MAIGVITLGSITGRLGMAMEQGAFALYSSFMAGISGFG
jgi:hypothetical protein